MFAKECEDSQSTAPGCFFIRDQLFGFSSASASSSSSYGTTSSATSSTSAISSLECMSSNTDHPPGFPIPSPLALHSVGSCTTLQPPLKLHHAADTKLSPPLKLHCIKPSSSPPPLSTHSRKVEPDHGAHVKRRMGLMKLRRQGSHPPAPTNKSCHGSFNQAAAARELMASLERLSMKEKTKGMNADQREMETQRALLAGEVEGEESLNAGSASRRNGLKLAMELPLTAKIAAAMDAEGLIGVQEEITLHCRNYKSRELQRNISDQCSPASANFKAKLSSTCKPRPARGAASSDREVRPTALHKMHCKRRRRWIIPRRVRSSRSLLGKLWMKLKRVFLPSSRKHLENHLYKVNNLN